MYCHEGPWQKVDRIWMIHTDGTHNTLIHKRTMLMEIAGHEFWGLDGETIWYDWQYPKGEDFFLAGYNLKTGQRTAYHMQRDEWSIHFNLTKDLDLFCGDGGDPGQVARARDGEWIELFRPQLVRGGDGALNSPNFWQPGVFHSERLVNMSHHYYREEPNVRFSPDKTLVHLHQQHVWAELRFWRGGGEGGESTRRGRAVDAGTGAEIQPSRSSQRQSSSGDASRALSRLGNTFGTKVAST